MRQPMMLFAVAMLVGACGTTIRPPPLIPLPSPDYEIRPPLIPLPTPRGHYYYRHRHHPR
jgi:hypothetical protein